MNNEEELKKKKDSPVNEDEVCVFFNMRKAARIITGIYDEVMRPLGYKGTQVTLLGVIARHENVTVNQLAGFMDTDRTTLTRNMAVLKREKLITTKTGEDKRQRFVVLTEKGKEVLMKAYPLWKATQQKIAESVGHDALNKLLADLGSALERVQKEKKF